MINGHEQIQTITASVKKKVIILQKQWPKWQTLFEDKDYFKLKFTLGWW